MLSVNCILLWFIDIYRIKVEFICKRNAYITLVWGFFSPFFSVAATSRMNHQKKRFFFFKIWFKYLFLLISGQQQSDI